MSAAFPYRSHVDKNRMRVLSVYADTDAMGGWLTDRYVVENAYPAEWRMDLATSAAIGWALNEGHLEKNPDSGSKRLTDEGRKFLALDELGVFLKETS